MMMLTFIQAANNTFHGYPEQRLNSEHMDLHLLSSTFKSSIITTSYYRNEQHRRITARVILFCCNIIHQTLPTIGAAKIPVQYLHNSENLAPPFASPISRLTESRVRSGDPNIEGDFPPWNLFCSLQVHRLLWPLQMECSVILCPKSLSVPRFASARILEQGTWILALLAGNKDICI